MDLKDTILRTLPLLALAACGDLDPPPDMMPTPTGPISNTDNADGSTTSLIDASELETWIYMDLESKKQVEVTNPGSSRDWDLAFQRFKVKLNGGDNGGAGVGAAAVDGSSFETLTVAPGAGYKLDAPDGADEGTIPDYAISVGPSSETGPWAYNVETHTLSDSHTLFVVKSVEGGYFKLEFTDYYDTAGSAGHVQMHWVKLDEALPPGVLVVTFPMRGDAHLSIDRGMVSVDMPDSSSDWDLAVNGPGWKTNSGEGRVGKGGAREAPSGSNYDALSSAGTMGYRGDTLIPYPGPPGSPRFLGNSVLVLWYDYDAINHVATPKDLVYLIRDAHGGYGKLKILAYDEPKREYRLKLERLTRALETAQQEIDASDTGAWVYYGLRYGAVLTVADALSDRDWDLAFSGVRIKTNSGTSGGGSGGAASAVNGALAALSEAPATGYAADAQIPDPYASGANYSGNPSLAAWYQATSTSTTPKDVVFPLKTADGTFAKVKVTAFAGGHYSIDAVYAGPEQTAF